MDCSKFRGLIFDAVVPVSILGRKLVGSRGLDSVNPSGDGELSLTLQESRVGRDELLRLCGGEKLYVSCGSSRYAWIGQKSVDLQMWRIRFWKHFIIRRMECFASMQSLYQVFQGEYRQIDRYTIKYSPLKTCMHILPYSTYFL